MKCKGCNDNVYASGQLELQRQQRQADSKDRSLLWLSVRNVSVSLCVHRAHRLRWTDLSHNMLQGQAAASGREQRSH